MITIQDLQEAIAECQGERNPNAQTCIKLAAYYTIMEHLEGAPLQSAPYSHESGPLPSFPHAGKEIYAHSEGSGESPFLEAVRGCSADNIWPIMDELMDAVQALQPRLYEGVMRRIRSG